MFVSYSHLTQETVPPGAVAVLPLGAMETHGPHLTLGTDGIIADGVLDHVARIDKSAATIVRLPLIWQGASAEHSAHAGTLSMEPEALIAQIVNIGEGLALAGINRIVLFNAHGGNVASASIAALKLRTRFEILAASVHWLDFGLPAQIRPPTRSVEDIHGGWMETSMLLHMAPQLVKINARAAQAAAPPARSLFPTGPVSWGWKIEDLAPDSKKTGWIGRPDLATAELGEALVTHAAQSLLTLLHELAAASWPNKS